MPTALPASPRTLSWSELVRFFLLLGRSHWLHRRLMAADRRVKRLGTDGAGLELLAVTGRWLTCHEEIAALLNLPLPPQVAQVKAVLRASRHRDCA